MLGIHGETLVIDWGLAKPLSRPTPVAEGDSAPAAPWPVSARALVQTRVGHTTGTAWYMSPEQAAGQTDRLGPATDVYTLGATLYRILTGQVPFDGPEEDEVRKLVQQGALPPPRQINPRVAPAPRGDLPEGDGDGTPRTATSRQSTWVTTSRAGSPRGRSRPDRPPVRGTGWPIQRSGAAKKKVVTVRPMPGSISMRSVTKGEIFSAVPTQGRLRTPGGGTRPGSPHISRG